MSDLVVHPSAPVEQVLLEAIRYARAELADRDQALALLADGLAKGVIDPAEAARTFDRLVRL